VPVHQTTEIKCSRQLIVEGYDEERFVSALLQHINVADVQTHNTRRRTNLASRLKAITSTPNFADRVTWLGVVLDAEEYATNTFHSISGELTRAGLTAPSQVMEPVDVSPRVSVLIFPGGDEPGTLETICLQSVADHQAIKCIEQ